MPLIYLRESESVCASIASCKDLCKWLQRLYRVDEPLSLHQSHELNHLLMHVVAAEGVGGAGGGADVTTGKLCLTLQPSSSCSDRLDIIRPDVQSHVKKNPQTRQGNPPVLQQHRPHNDAGPEWEVKHVPTRAKSLLHDDSWLPWSCTELVCFIYSCFKRKFSCFLRKKKCIAYNRWDVRKLCLGTSFLSWILLFSSKYKILSCESGRNAHKLQPSAVVTDKILSLAFNQWPLQCPVVFY